MKYIIVIILFITSCKTVQLTDGTYITKRQERKIYEKVFNETFGQMTEEESQLFEGVNFTLDTSIVQVSDTSERIIKVFNDTSYVESPSFTIYIELIPSKGDTTTLYNEQYFILNGISYINFDTTMWVNYRGVEIYR
jgi:hypothetical protein